MNILAQSRILAQAMANRPANAPPIDFQSQVRTHNSALIWREARQVEVPYRVDPNNPESPLVRGLIAEHGMGGPPHEAGKDPRPHIVVCSIYTAPLMTDLFHQIFSRPRFVFEPSGPGEFRSMRIYQGRMRIRDLSTIEDSFETHVIHDTNMAALATDIMTQIAMGMPNSTQTCRPGVMPLTDDIPTEEEYRALRAMQYEWNLARVREADEWHDIRRNGGKPEGMINAWHHAALEALGDFDPGRHPWYHQIKEQLLKACAACGGKMAASAAVHGAGNGGCGIDLLKFYRESLYLSPDEVAKIDPALAPVYAGVLNRLWANQQAAQVAQQANQRAN